MIYGIGLIARQPCTARFFSLPKTLPANLFSKSYFHAGSDSGKKYFYETIFAKNLFRGLSGVAIGAAAVLIAQESQRQLSHRRSLNESVQKETSTTVFAWPPIDITSQMTQNVEEFSPSFIPDKDLHTLGGNSEIIENVADLVRYLQNPADFTKLGAKPPNGVIFSGPPGVGKTLLAEAIAGHAGVRFILVSAGELQASRVGATEENLRQLFKQAEQSAPCVLCLDEIDSLGAKRITSSDSANSSAHYINGVVNQLLTLLSKNHPGVIVIATTNHFETLDSALVRPGRFDRHIVLSLPNLADRERILTIHTKEKSLSRDISLKDLASISGGFSGAKLAAWVNEAALLANREQSSLITGRHFDEARSLLTIGILRQSSADPQQKYRTALHEAGHALVGYLLNHQLYKITIRRGGGLGGYVEWIPFDERQTPTKQELLDNICILLAGRAAEHLSGNVQIGNDSDLKKAKEFAQRMIYDEAMGATILGSIDDVEMILQQEMRRAQMLLKEHQGTWELIRDTLIERDELLGADFLTLVTEKKLPDPKGHFFWQKSSNANPAKRPLPPTAAKLPKSLPAMEIQSTAQKSGSFHFTIEQVAKALGMNPSAIRKIKINKYNHDLEICFSFVFADDEHMEYISQKLEKYNVRNFYSPSTQRLRILEAGIKEFIKFVDKYK